MEFYRKGEQHLIENYDKAKKDNFRGWCIHHRLELTLDGEFAHTPKELIRLGMYYNRPYFELIYLKNSEHIRLHNKSRTISQETKDKISKSVKKAFDEGRLDVSGEKNGMYGNKLSEETKKKLSDVRKGKPATWNMHPMADETKRKISKTMKEKPLPKIKSEFGKKFFEHYGLRHYQDNRLYQTEYAWWKRNGKCRWE